MSHTTFVATCAHRIAAPFVVAMLDFTLSRNTTALLFPLVLVHGVLKWLHHLLLKYVMLLHAGAFSHDVLHCSRLETFPGEFARYASPAPPSHATFEPAEFHVGLTPEGAATVVGFMVVAMLDFALSRITTALLFALVLVHGVLK